MHQHNSNNHPMSSTPSITSSSTFDTYRKQGDIFTFLEKLPSLRDAQIWLNVFFAKEAKSVQPTSTPIYSPTQPLADGEFFVVQRKTADGKNVDIWDEYKNIVLKTPDGWIFSGTVSYAPIHVAEYGIFQVGGSAPLPPPVVTETGGTPAAPVAVVATPVQADVATTPAPVAAPTVGTPTPVPVAPVPTPVADVATPTPTPVAAAVATPAPTPTPAVVPTPAEVAPAKTSSSTTPSTANQQAAPSTGQAPGYIIPTFVFTKPINAPAPAAAAPTSPLTWIKSIYETESMLCLPYSEACKVGNAIRAELSPEQNRELLAWCMAKYKTTKRADLANLIGYINRWALKDSVVAETYFRYAANNGYPLAMSNLVFMNVPDRDYWQAELGRSGYKC